MAHNSSDEYCVNILTFMSSYFTPPKHLTHSGTEKVGIMNLF